MMIKVTDEAVEKALISLEQQGVIQWNTVRAAVEAAVPLLRVQAGGDGGLREALTELAKDRDCVNGAVPSDYFITPYEILELLRTHPAAPAVPQPVDREAIEREIRRATTAMLCNSDIPGWTVQEEVSKAADVVLALLSPEETK